MQLESAMFTRPTVLTHTSFCALPLLNVMVAAALAVPLGVKVGFDADAIVIPG